MPPTRSNRPLNALLSCACFLMLAILASACGSGGGPEGSSTSGVRVSADRVVSAPGGDIIVLGRTGRIQQQGCEGSDLAAVRIGARGDVKGAKSISVDGCAVDVETAISRDGAVTLMADVFHPNTDQFGDGNASDSFEILRLSRDGSLGDQFRNDYVDTLGGPCAFGVMSDGSIIDTGGQRYLANGKIGSGPEHETGDQTFAGAIAVWPDDSFAVLSERRFAHGRVLPPRQLIVRAFTRDGQRETHFGGGGQSVFRFSPQPVGFDGASFMQMYATPDHGLLIFGSYHPNNLYGPGTERFVALKLTRGGQFDPGFGHRGRLVLPPHGPVSVQRDGKFIVAAASNGHTILSRYNRDGTPDRGFGRGGRSAVLIDGRGLTSVVELPGGAIVGTSVVEETSTTAGVTTVFRLDPRGRLDRGFGRDGLLDLAGPAAGA